MQKQTALRDVLSFGDGDAMALAAPSAKPMTFAGCASWSRNTGVALARFGAGGQDRVAIVLPNGPEMAAAFLSVASHAASAPLNPAYKAEEFEFYLSDLSAKLLIVEEGSTSPAMSCQKARRQDRHADAGAGSRRGQLHAQAAMPGEAAPAQGSRRRRKTSRWCCTPRAPPRGPRSCRSASATSAPRRCNIGQTLSAHAGRPLPRHHAAVSHSRPDRHRARLASPRAAACSARRASTPSNSSPGSRRPSPLGTARCRPCTRPSCPRRAQRGDHPAPIRLRFIRSSSVVAAAPGADASWKATSTRP